jgi:beta-lactam-binding protein with PASTA domain
VVSSGQAQVTVPSVKGLTKAAADDAISKVGLIPDATCRETPAAPSTGIVSDQSPAANTKVDKGTTVKYDVQTSDSSICS